MRPGFAVEADVSSLSPRGVGIYEVEALRNPQTSALPAGGFARNLIAREFPLRSA
jgi:hypothetical protein